MRQIIKESKRGYSLCRFLRLPSRLQTFKFSEIFHPQFVVNLSPGKGEIRLKPTQFISSLAGYHLA